MELPSWFFGTASYAVEPLWCITRKTDPLRGWRVRTLYRQTETNEIVAIYDDVRFVDVGRFDRQHLVLGREDVASINRSDITP